MLDTKATAYKLCWMVLVTPSSRPITIYYTLSHYLYQKQCM